MAISLDAQRVVEELRSARKYQHLCCDTLARIADWAVARASSEKDAIKRAKRKLHQISGAYPLSEFRRLADVMSKTDFAKQDLRSFCMSILRMHTSTAERIDHMQDAFQRILPRASRISRVLDLGGGLNAFALPWMGLDPAAEYVHFDVDHQLTDIVNLFLQRIEHAGRSECRDILTWPVTESADVAFLLKVVPCLEQQRVGASLDILRTLQVPRAVVSFPTRSLGGRSHGMYEHYHRMLHQLTGKISASVEEWRYPTETYYVLNLDNSSRKETKDSQ